MSRIKHEKLNDADDRFLVAQIDAADHALRESLADYVVKNNKDANYISQAMMKYGVTGDEGGPTGHRLVDTISNREFAVIQYAEIAGKLDKEKPFEEQASFSVILSEIKDNKAVGTPESAAKAMGLPEGVKFDSTDNLRDVISSYQNDQPRPEDNGRPASDTRAVITAHTKREAALDSYLETQKEIIEQTTEQLVEENRTVDLSTLPKDEQLKAWAIQTNLRNQVKETQLNALKAIVTPEKFDVSNDGTAYLVNAEDLNNQFAKTTDNTTIPLGDPENKYNIGKVSLAHIEDSPSILAGDKILTAIRVRASGDDKVDTNIYAIQNGDENWIRAERVSQDGFEMIDEQALRSIGVNSDKLMMGGDTSASQVIEQVSPAGLREHIARQQILANKVWKKEPAFGSEPVKEHKAADWAYPRSSDDGDSVHSVLEVRALKQINAQKVDNRTTVVDLSAKQVQQLEDFALIREAGIESGKGYDYVGGASGHVIIDHKNNVTQIIGQALINTDRNDGPGFKKIEVTEFDFAMRPDRPDRIGVQYAVSGSSPGIIDIDVFSSTYNEAHGDEWELGGDAMRADFKGEQVMVADEPRFTGKNIVEALAASDDIVYDNDPKMLNNFGRGIKHDSVISLERASALRHGHDVKMEAMDRIEPAKPARAKM
ncbi:hypothetical protein [uncultured Psychrobacter sp.]|uniref:hypothetical protein n=1 Tax=uncultured Psychrobacter sp. TaxID=259303 RepID=UPI0030DA27D7